MVSEVERQRSSYYEVYIVMGVVKIDIGFYTLVKVDSIKILHLVEFAQSLFIHNWYLYVSPVKNVLLLTYVLLIRLIPNQLCYIDLTSAPPYIIGRGTRGLIFLWRPYVRQSAPPSYGSSVTTVLKKKK